MSILLTVFKLVVLMVGLAFTLANFFPGVLGNRAKLKKAALIFGSTWVILFLLSMLDLAVALLNR